MDYRIRRVVILGGGTAGWMTASYLGKSLQGTAEIIVLEAPSIPKIGVGEASVPNLQPAFFDYLGIAEDEWMRECNASFKMAVKFINWRTPGPGDPVARTMRDGRPDHFYHPFGLLPSPDQIPLSHYWALRHEQGKADLPFDYSCFTEPPLMDANLAPRYRDGRKAVNYAWHFDAQLLADFLRKFATEKQGVKHVHGEMVEALQDERGFITGLRTRSGEILDGDLFVDCSGFRGLLINQVMEEPFLDMRDHLLCDSAVACPVPYTDEESELQPYTSAIAMSAGWAWKTPLLGRFGTGYVYSSQYSDQEAATEEFCLLWGLDRDRRFNQIRFRVGRNRRSWVNNCVSIGLSSCFLEPLESSGIYFIYAAIYQLAKHFPDRRFNPVLQNRFNREIADMFDDTRDFLQAHFYYSPRTDTPFWRANKDLVMAPQIREKVEMFRAGIPVNPPASDEGTYYGNFEAEFRNFWTNGSYYSILAGLGVEPDQTLPALAYKPDSVRAGDLKLQSVRERQQELMAVLPSVHDYLKDLHGDR